MFLATFKKQQTTDVESLVKGINTISSTETSNSVSKTPIPITPTNQKKRTGIGYKQNPDSLHSNSKGKPSVISMESSSMPSVTKNMSNFFGVPQLSPKTSANGATSKKYPQQSSSESKPEVRSQPRNKSPKLHVETNKKNQKQLNITPVNEQSQTSKEKRMTPDSIRTRKQLSPQNSKTTKGNFSNEDLPKYYY